MNCRHCQTNMLKILIIIVCTSRAVRHAGPFSPIIWGIQKLKMGIALAHIGETLILISS
jgi:hypothetical protein